MGRAAGICRSAPRASAVLLGVSAVLPRAGAVLPWRGPPRSGRGPTPSRHGPPGHAVLPGAGVVLPSAGVVLPGVGTRSSPEVPYQLQNQLRTQRGLFVQSPCLTHESLALGGAMPGSRPRAGQRSFWNRLRLVGTVRLCSPGAGEAGAGRRAGEGRWADPGGEVKDHLGPGRGGLTLVFPEVWQDPVTVSISRSSLNFHIGCFSNQEY